MWRTARFLVLEKTRSVPGASSDINEGRHWGFHYFGVFIQPKFRGINRFA
jgi:hypothetical protein